MSTYRFHVYHDTGAITFCLEIPFYLLEAKYLIFLHLHSISNTTILDFILTVRFIIDVIRPNFISNTTILYFSLTVRFIIDVIKPNCV